MNSGWDLRYVNNRRACRISGVKCIRPSTDTLILCTYKEKAKAERDVIVL